MFQRYFGLFFQCLGIAIAIVIAVLTMGPGKPAAAKKACPCQSCQCDDCKCCKK